MIYTLHGTNANKLHEFICVAPNTSQLILARLRHVMSVYIDSLILNGTVEVDECMHGAKPIWDLRITKYWTRRRQKLIVGMKLREIRDKRGKLLQAAQIIYRLIGDCREMNNAKNVMAEMRKYIHPDSKIVTDGSEVYNLVGDFFYKHDVVVHSIQIKVPKHGGGFHIIEKKKFVDYIVHPDGTKSRVHTNGIEGMWRHWKRKFQDQCSMSYSHTQSYLDECAFLFNVKEMSVLDRFNMLLQLCCNNTTSAKQLKKHMIIENVPVITKSGKIRLKRKLLSYYKANKALTTKKIFFNRYL